MRACHAAVLAIACFAVANGTGAQAADSPPVAGFDLAPAIPAYEVQAVEAYDRIQDLDERAERVLAEVDAPGRTRSLDEIRQELDAIAKERMQWQNRSREASDQHDRAIIDNLKSRSVLFSGTGVACGVMELLYPKFIGTLEPKVAETYPAQMWYAADSSESGLQDLLSGKTEAAVLNRPLTAEEQAALKKAFPDATRQPRQITLCRAAVAVVVPRSRRVRGMTIEQVEQVFRGTIEKWSTFGGIEQTITPVEDQKLSDEYPLQEVISIIVHPDAPATTKAFVEFATGPKAAQVVRQCGLWPECELKEEKPTTSARPSVSKASERAPGARK